MINTTVTPIVSNLNVDSVRYFLGAQTWLRSTSSETSGALGIIEQVIPAGFESPYHIHHAEDEAFYVIEGAVRFVSGDQSWVAMSGGFAFLPRDIPHGFRIEGDVAARVLIIVTPAGFESFVDELCESVPSQGAPDLPKVAEAAARHNVEILGPLPG